MSERITVYVSIGNSDDKLTQAEWSRFVADVRGDIICAGGAFLGSWVSPSSDPWQNACWCFTIVPGVRDRLRECLASRGREFRQDAVAWAEVPVTDFL